MHCIHSLHTHTASTHTHTLHTHTHFIHTHTASTHTLHPHTHFVHTHTASTHFIHIHTHAHCIHTCTVSPTGGVSATPIVHNSRVNQSVQFLCTSRGGPGNNYTWTRLLDNTVVGNSALLNVDVVGADIGGTYQCHVTNRAGNGTFQPTLNGTLDLSTN